MAIEHMEVLDDRGGGAMIHQPIWINPDESRMSGDRGGFRDQLHIEVYEDEPEHIAYNLVVQQKFLSDTSLVLVRVTPVPMLNNREIAQFHHEFSFVLKDLL